MEEEVFNRIRKIQRLNNSKTQRLKNLKIEGKYMFAFFNFESFSFGIYTIAFS
jgi:hypothetical protein